MCPLHEVRKMIRSTYDLMGGKGYAKIGGRWVLPLIIILFSVSALPALGQSTFGSVRGIVQDESGAAVPDAMVVLHSTDENVDKTARADASGSFGFENIKAGHYTLH